MLFLPRNEKAIKRDDEAVEKLTRRVRYVLPNLFWKEITQYCHVFRTERHFKQKVHAELLSEPPVLRMALMIKCPNLIEGLPYYYHGFRYEYADRIPALMTRADEIPLAEHNRQREMYRKIERLQFLPQMSWEQTVIFTGGTGTFSDRCPST